MATRAYDLDQMQIRDMVTARLRELGVTNYQFAMACTDKRPGHGVAYTSTYRFLNGRSNLSIENLEWMMWRLGIRFVPDAKARNEEWAEEIKAAADEAIAATPR